MRQRVRLLSSFILVGIDREHKARQLVLATGSAAVAFNCFVSFELGTVAVVLETSWVISEVLRDSFENEVQEFLAVHAFGILVNDVNGVRQVFIRAESRKSLFVLVTFNQFLL